MSVEKKKGLGKGLEAIFGEDMMEAIEDIQQGKVDAGGKTNEIALAEIRPNPYQPRKIFDESALNDLAESIREHGVFTPILLRKSVQGYEIIAGERRWRASKIAKKETIPAIIMDFTDAQMMEISILENVQREDLNPLEEASAYQHLAERLEYTQEVLAQRVGKSRTYVTNIMRLLKLPQPIQQMVTEKKLSIGHVRPLVTIEDEDLAIEIAEKACKEGLSVRSVEALTKELAENNNNKKTKVKPLKKKDPNLVYVENLMELKLQTYVTLEKNEIRIKYTSDSDLNRILELLGCIEE
ncbi:MAG: ParB/RepB/Spo0J family partition protein [Longicatena sp.]|uniref:ParB/RepB/Spo0J family partition protein n=1 Tax=Anaerorhabdus sp. TaxID=1872524 RepID=UPI002FC7A285